MILCSLFELDKMFIVVLTGFAWFACGIQISACLTWTKYPDSVTRVWNGSTVALKWDYNLTTQEQNAANIAINWIWNRGNESHLEFVGSKNFISGSSLAYAEDLAPHIVISRSEEATLIINDVTKEDEAVYKLTLGLLTLGNLRISRNFTLEVRVQPTLQCPETVIVTQGELAIILCNATGDPEPNRTWTKQSQPNSIISTNSTLIIHKVSISDGGTYNSTANNGRSASVLVELIIYFSPKMTNLTIESNPKNTTVLLNSSLTLHCVTNANPPALYHLYFNDSYIGNSSSGEFTTTAKGDGVYTCVPINAVGTGNNATLNIIAVVRPSIKISNKTATAVEGDRLNFTCTPSGKPKPNLAWTEVGKAGEIALTPSVSVIVGRPETPDNMIQYQCTASNGVETPATATVNVTVYYEMNFVSFKLQVEDPPTLTRRIKLKGMIQQ